MDSALRQAVASHLAEAWGETVEVRSTRPVSGGSIHSAFEVELSGVGRVFVKANRQAPAEMFEREAEGLAALGEVALLRVPRHPLPGAAGGMSFLILEWIESGTPGAGFLETFGRDLARLHRSSAEAGRHGGRFGYSRDGWIGATRQPNAWSEDWVEFWRQHRLGFQLQLAREGGRSDRELESLGAR
ncbi:MAG: fructosamine kinase family protein, partial [Acidobacteria bacterium]|nr:fructosamine kinase family protein [Acidobacteriota bacterium]